MNIRVRLFAILRDRAGLAECTLGLPDATTVGGAVEPLLKRLPALRTHIDSCRYALNQTYTTPDQTLHDGDELALIPPVSGG